MKSQINNLASQRLVWLDALKGIGILLIMTCHAGLLPRISIFLTAGYVSIFFVASGFTYKSKQTFAGEIAKRSKRLLLPYFFYVSLSIILMNALNIKNDLVHQVLGMLYSRYSLYFGIKDIGDIPMLTLTCNSPTWFLTALFTSLMILFVIKSLRWQWVVIMCLGFSVLALNLPFLLPWSLDTAFVGALFIYLGKKIWGGNSGYRIIKHGFLVC